MVQRENELQGKRTAPRHVKTGARMIRRTDECAKMLTTNPRPIARLRWETRRFLPMDDMGGGMRRGSTHSKAVTTVAKLPMHQHSRAHRSLPVRASASGPGLSVSDGVDEARIPTKLPCWRGRPAAAARSPAAITPSADPRNSSRTPPSVMMRFLLAFRPIAVAAKSHAADSLLIWRQSLVPTPQQAMRTISPLWKN
jgi:hypothetical protein